MILRFIIICFLISPSQITLSAQQLERYESSNYKMGTSWNIIIYTTDEQSAQDAFHLCWDRVDQLNLIFSDYDEHSEASRLSKSSGSNIWMTISDELWEVLTFSHRLSTLTNGAFDVTIGPLSKIWRRAIRQQQYPKQKYLKEAQSKVDYNFIKYDSINRKVMLTQSGMSLDFGSIAKGYAVDQIYELLEEQGVDHKLVDGGGDLRASEHLPKETRWLVRLGSRQDSILLSDQSIATSGDTFKHLKQGENRYAHIIDPLTAQGVKNMHLTTVIANSCMMADALASAISVMGNEVGRALIKHYNDSFFYITLPNGVLLRETSTSIPD